MESWKIGFYTNIGDKSMKLINSKSCLNCNEVELIKHNKEIEDIINSLKEEPNYTCAAIYKYFDEVNKSRSPVIKATLLHDCWQMVEYADIKHGVDLAIVENFLTFICYGEMVDYNKKCYIVTTGIQIRPYDDNQNYIYVNFKKGV